MSLPARGKQFLGATLSLIHANDIPDGHPVSLMDQHLRSLRVSEGAISADFQPMDVPELLPFVTILTIVDAARTAFQYKLVGSAIVALIGKDPTGEFFGYELDDEARRVQSAILTQASGGKDPIFVTGVMAGRQGVGANVILGLYPWCSQAAGVDQLLIVVAPRTLHLE